jgi:hypothetical protein
MCRRVRGFLRLFSRSFGYGAAAGDYAERQQEAGSHRAHVRPRDLSRNVERVLPPIVAPFGPRQPRIETASSSPIDAQIRWISLAPITSSARFLSRGPT